MRVNFFVKQMQISPLYKYGMDCLVVRIALNKEASEKSLFCVCVGRHRALRAGVASRAAGGATEGSAL